MEEIFKNSHTSCFRYIIGKEVSEVNSEIYFLNNWIQGDNNFIVWKFLFLMNSFLSESIHSWLMW